MGVELYDHQLEAIDKLRTGAILCGGVGSGKSRTAIAYYFLRECEGKIKINGRGCYLPMKKPKDLYIITTAKKRDSMEWDEECSPFLLSRNPDNTPSKIKLVIDSWNNIKKYIDVKDSFFIFDEQRVVGSGLWVKSFLKIAKSNNWILLTATPGDSWIDYVPVFIANGYYPNRTAFKKRHVIENPYSPYHQIEGYRDEGRLIKIRNRIMVKMKYEKPTISHYKTRIAEYDHILYKDLIRNRWNFYKDKPIENISELMYSMRRVVNSDESRIEIINELLNKHKKLIVFYNFNYELDALKTAKYDQNVKIGEWNSHKHEPIPSAKCWLYLVQYAAGAEGWNCIETNAIAFYSQSYSYKTVTQAEGRIDRLNTPFKDLYYYHIRSNASIDVAISRALKKKQNFNAKMFAQNNNL